MKEMLYTMTSRVDGFEKFTGRYFDNVRIRWYVTERSTEAYGEYKEILEQYLSALAPTKPYPSINVLNGYFTAKECDCFEKYLRDTKGWTANRTEKRTLNPENKADVHRLAIKSQRKSELYIVTEGSDIGYEVAGLVSWHATTLSPAQSLELDVRISRETMKSLLPAMENRFSNVAKMIQQSVQNTIKERTGNISPSIEVVCDELIFEDDLDYEYDRSGLRS